MFASRRHRADDYWQMIIDRILDSNWWNCWSRTGLLKAASEASVAFLDVRFYDPN